MAADDAASTAMLLGEPALTRTAFAVAAPLATQGLIAVDDLLLTFAGPLVERPLREPALPELRRLLSRLVDLGREDTIPVFLARHLMIALSFRVGRRRRLAAATPRLASRYIREYLALGLSPNQRREIFLFHHDQMQRRFSDGLFDAILLDAGAPLWRGGDDETLCEIRLHFDTGLHGEGDLILGFYADGVRLYDLAFSLCPASVTGAGRGPGLFIGRVQGRRSKVDALRRAARACGDITPSHMLLSAAEGVAAALSLRDLLGVGSAAQLSSRWDREALEWFDYDAFFGEFFEEREGAWYRAEAPLRRKPLASVTASHRRRARKKRQMKDAVTEAVRGALAGQLKA